MVIALGLASWGILLTLAGLAFDLGGLRGAAMVVSLLGLAVMVLHLAAHRLVVLDPGRRAGGARGLGRL